MLPAHGDGLRPVDDRKHDVENDDVGLPGRNEMETALTIVRDRYIVLRPRKITPDDLCGLAFILDDEDPCCCQRHSFAGLFLRSNPYPTPIPTRS